MFKTGARIFKYQLIDTQYYAIKLTSKSASSINDYNNTTITGGTSGVIAEVVKVSATDGTDPDTIFVKYAKQEQTIHQQNFQTVKQLTSDAGGSPTVVVATAIGNSAAAIEAKLIT